MAQPRGQRYYLPNGRRRNFNDPTFHDWMQIRHWYKQLYGDEPHPWSMFAAYLEDIGEHPNDGQAWSIAWEPRDSPPGPHNVFYRPTQWHKKMPLEVSGVVKTVFEWAQELGIPHKIILTLKKLGYDPADVVRALMSIKPRT